MRCKAIMARNQKSRAAGKNVNIEMLPDNFVKKKHIFKYIKKVLYFGYSILKIQYIGQNVFEILHKIHELKCI